jgi:hypothetical protein
MSSINATGYFAEVRSFDSIKLFKRNSSSGFTVQFDRELIFNGKWELALFDFVLKCQSHSDRMDGNDIYIFSNIIEHGFVGANMKQLLRRVNVGSPVISSSHSVYTFHSTCALYKRICVRNCLSIEFQLENEMGKIVTFPPNSNVILTLHFKPCD